MDRESCISNVVGLDWPRELYFKVIHARNLLVFVIGSSGLDQMKIVYPTDDLHKYP